MIHLFVIFLLITSLINYTAEFCSTQILKGQKDKDKVYFCFYLLTHEIIRIRSEQGSISPTFYAQLLC